MYIEKTTVIHFDEAEERKRILACFKGEQQKILLALLDAFEAGNWDSLCEQACALPKGWAEYLASPIYDVTNEILEQKQRRAAYANGYVPSKDTVYWSLQAGRPIGPIAGEYPRFDVRKVEPAAESQG